MRLHNGRWVEADTTEPRVKLGKGDGRIAAAGLQSGALWEQLVADLHRSGVERARARWAALFDAAVASLRATLTAHDRLVAENQFNHEGHFAARLAVRAEHALVEHFGLDPELANALCNHRDERGHNRRWQDVLQCVALASYIDARQLGS